MELSVVKKCLHSNVIFVDDQNCHTCTDCGLQLQDFCDENMWVEKIVPCEIPKVSASFRAELRLLEIVCAQYHVAQCIENTAESFLLDFNLPRSFKTGSAAAASLYKSCEFHGACRQLKDVSHWFKVETRHTKNIYDLNVKFAAASLRPLDGLEHARQNLQELEFAEIEAGGQMADEMFDNYSCHPFTLLAVCLFAKSGKKKKISLRKCAAACHVSPTSVSRLYKKLYK